MPAGDGVNLTRRTLVQREEKAGGVLSRRASGGGNTQGGGGAHLEASRLEAVNLATIRHQAENRQNFV